MDTKGDMIPDAVAPVRQAETKDFPVVFGCSPPIAMLVRRQCPVSAAEGFELSLDLPNLKLNCVDTNTSTAMEDATTWQVHLVWTFSGRSGHVICGATKEDGLLDRDAARSW